MLYYGKMVTEEVMSNALGNKIEKEIVGKRNA